MNALQAEIYIVFLTIKFFVCAHLVLFDYQELGIAWHKAPGCMEHPSHSQRVEEVGTYTAHAQVAEDQDTSGIIVKQKWSIY